MLDISKDPGMVQFSFAQAFSSFPAARNGKDVCHSGGNGESNVLVNLWGIGSSMATIMSAAIRSYTVKCSAFNSRDIEGGQGRGHRASSRARTKSADARRRAEDEDKQKPEREQTSYFS